MDAPIVLVQSKKSLTQRVALHIEGKAFVRRFWKEDRKGKITFDRTSRTAQSTRADAEAQLARDIASWLAKGFVHDQDSAPLPETGERSGAIARLEALSFPWKKNLRKGAKPSALDALEKKLAPARLPAELRALLAWRDGVDALPSGFRCWGQRWLLLGAEDIARERATLVKVHGAPAKHWIPFLHDEGGDYTCVGKKGEIFLCWRDEDPLVVHESFDAWMNTFVAAMESGSFKSERAWRALHAKMNPEHAR